MSRTDEGKESEINKDKQKNEVRDTFITRKGCRENNHIIIVTFLLELDIYTRVNNCGAFIDRGHLPFKYSPC